MVTMNDLPRARPAPARAQVVALLVLLTAVTGCEFCATPPSGEGDLPVWVLDKAAFQDGEAWWVQRTVIDAPYNAKTFIGDGDLSETIRWRIEERWLIAERADPLIVGVAGDGQVDELRDYAAPVAVYPILWHFDVIGGQMIDVPNRNWFEKQWMRVDWGTNLITEHRFVGLQGNDEGVSWWESNPEDENYPVFQSDYVDFTTHNLLQATDGVDPISLQSVSCQTFLDYVDCAPLEITYRTSYRKKPPGHRYEPVDEAADDRPPFFNGTNLFATITYEVDGERGIVDGGRKTKLLRFDLWDRSYDDAGAPLRFADRAAKPIVFHLDTRFPDELKALAQRSVEAWDLPLKETVFELRYWECRDEGGDDGDCRASAETPETMIVLCENNPVKPGDDERCGKPGTVARLGDMRFNTIEWVRNATGVQPIAVAWWSPEMPTGEIVSVHVKLNAAALDRAAVYLTDLTLMVQGRAPFKPTEDPSLQEASLRWLQTQGARRASFPAPPPASLQPVEVPRGTGVVDRVTPASTDRAAGLAPLLGTRIEGMMASPEDAVAWGLEEQEVEATRMAELSTLRRAYADRVAARGGQAGRLASHAIDVDLPVELDVTYIANEFQDLASDEIFARLQRDLVETVIIHELGHTLGIRHNFQGSFDALNFTPEYWRVRSECEGPRWKCPYTEAELAGGIHDHAYSSVMDYFPRLRATPNGLGPFDTAAIKALYGNMSQVFDDPTLGDNALALDVVRGLSATTVLHFPLILDDDFAAPRGYRPRSVHYSRYPSIFGNLSARSSVPARHLNRDRGLIVANDGRLIVPFMFCDDRAVSLFPHCRQFDHGADPYENVRFAVNWGRTYYSVNSFRNGRIDWRADEAFSAIAVRAYNPIKAWNDQYAQYRFDFADYPEFFDDDDGLATTAAAAREGFNWMVELLATPEVGSHVLTDVRSGAEPELVPAPETFMYGIPGGNDAAADATIPLGAGRGSRSGFVADGGGYRVNNIGSFLDKEYALEILFNSSYWSFPGQETWEPVELWTVNYHVTFPEPLLDVLGAIVADDWQRLAPRLGDDDQLHYRDFADLDSTVEGTVVSPAVGFNLRVRALVYALSTLYAGYQDRSVIDFARIARVGSAEEVPSANPAVDWIDPESGITWRAYSRLGEQGHELSVGARVLARAADLDARLLAMSADDPTRDALEGMLQRQRAIIDVMRAVVAEYDAYYFTP